MFHRKRRQYRSRTSAALCTHTLTSPIFLPLLLSSNYRQRLLRKLGEHRVVLPRPIQQRLRVSAGVNLRNQVANLWVMQILLDLGGGGCGIDMNDKLDRLREMGRML